MNPMKVCFKVLIVNIACSPLGLEHPNSSTGQQAAGRVEREQALESEGAGSNSGSFTHSFLWTLDSQPPISSNVEKSH